MSNDIDSVLAEINEMKKAAFTPAQPMPAAPGGVPQGGAPMPPAGAPGGESLSGMLMQAGIDPNMLLQDPNMAQQVAQQAGIPVDQLMQALQAEMGGAPPQGGAPIAQPAGAPQGGAPMPPPPQGVDPITEIMGVVDQLATAVQDLQGQLQSIQQEHTQMVADYSTMKGQLEVLTKILDQTPEF